MNLWSKIPRVSPEIAMIIIDTRNHQSISVGILPAAPMSIFSAMILIEVAMAFLVSSHSKRMSAGTIMNPAPAHTSPVINPTIPHLSPVRIVFSIGE